MGSAKYYPFVQCFGAFFGAWAAVDTVGDFQQIGYPMVHLDADGSADHMQALLAELLASFMLCYVFRPRPPGAVKRPSRPLAFPYVNRFCMGLLYGRAGRLTG